MIKEKKEMSCIENGSNESIATYLYSVITSYLPIAYRKLPYKRKSLFGDGGLQPHTPTRKLDASITSQTVTAPITIMNDPQDWDDYLGKSDSSTSSSSGSSWSSMSSSPEHRHRRSVSSAALSEILCNHYVQSHHLTHNQEVPLETYKVFEASRRRSSSSSSSGRAQPNENCRNIEDEDDEDDDESWFIWDNLQKTREWIQVVDEELFLPKEKVLSEVTMTAESIDNRKPRGVRSNPAHLRMIVAEVNMMRSDKIVGPLRPRGFLKARNDQFLLSIPSPLRREINL